MPSERYEYRESEPLTRKDAERILVCGTVVELTNALIAIALSEDDAEYAGQYVMSCVRHPDPQIRATAVLCLGHFARIHGTLPAGARDVVAAAMLDDDIDIRGQALAADDDIRMFAPQDAPP